MPNHQDRIAGGLMGLLVGDALGVPYEFKPPTALPPIEEIDYDPPSDFPRTYAGVKPGTWSDDGATALCLLASLLECGKLNVADFGERLVRWWRQGYMAVDDHLFDIGRTTREACANLAEGIDPLMAGPRFENSNGNGSLMRSLPLALCHRGSDEELIQDAMDQSKVSHGHLRSQICCAIYCLWARRILEVSDNPWLDALSTFEESQSDQPDVMRELNEEIHPHQPTKRPGSGYVVDTLLSARDVMGEDSYEQVVRKAVALGHDTDTTACVAGGIAGVWFGVENIPERWRVGLRGREIYEPLLEQLLKLHSGDTDG